jgi:hypothetical protein
MEAATASEVRFYSGAIALGSGAVLLSLVVSGKGDGLTVFISGGLFLDAVLVFGMTFSESGRQRLGELYSGIKEGFEGIGRHIR